MAEEAEARTSEAYDAWESATNWLLIVLSIAFVLVLIAPLVFHLTPGQQTAVFLANIAIWIVFLVDYLVRLYLVPDRWKFVRTHVVDLLVVAVPFLRPLRLLRLFAILAEFTRRSQASLAGRATALVFTVAAVIMTVCAVVVFSFERNHHGSTIRTFPDALWWAVSTVTTVGYGDRYPSTEAGRAVAVVLMLTGIALVGTITAAIAAWFVGSSQQATGKLAHSDAQQAQEERSRLTSEVEAMRASLEDLRAEITALRRQGVTADDPSDSGVREAVDSP